MTRRLRLALLGLLIALGAGSFVLRTGAPSYGPGPAPPGMPRPPQPQPTPGFFDLAQLPRSPAPAPAAVDLSITALAESGLQPDDLLHPEIYFELAAGEPQMNRPDQQHATLGFFLAYRDKLQHDLAALPVDAEEHDDLRAAIARYDDAIARLRRRIAGVEHE